MAGTNIHENTDNTFTYKLRLEDFIGRPASLHNTFNTECSDKHNTIITNKQIRRCIHATKMSPTDICLLEHDVGWSVALPSQIPKNKPKYILPWEIYQPDPKKSWPHSTPNNIFWLAPESLKSQWEYKLNILLLLLHNLKCLLGFETLATRPHKNQRFIRTVMFTWSKSVLC